MADESTEHRAERSSTHKPKVRDPQAWEEDDFPKMEERVVETAKMDPAKLARMRAAAKKKMQESKGVDPATLNRRWEISLAITGIENTTNDKWEVFMAVKLGHVSNHRQKKGRFNHKYTFTRSYVVASQEKKQFKSMEIIFDRKWEGSYKELTQHEVAIDIWLVSRTNFNQILGTAQKTLYEMGCESVFQTLLVKPNQTMKSTAFDIGIVYVNSVVSETMQFTIVASNWQFQQRPELPDQRAPKSLRIEMPTGRSGPLDVFTTRDAQWPRYCWPQAGQFVYTGTRVGLTMEAVTISVLSGGRLQGKAIVSLGAAGEYPIAVGTVKALSQNANSYVQGRVAGNLAVTARSLLVKEGVHDEDPSVLPPEQPADSLILSHLSPGLQYLVVELSGAQGLPVADADYGSSNAFCRVKYDGIVQQSPVVEGSLSPTWNHTFYLPVRLTDEQIRTNEVFYRKLLPLEMQSKGFLEVEIWHFDSVPTEFLGAFRLDLQELLLCREAQRALCQRATSTATAQGAGRAESSVSMGVHPALSRKYSTKVYEGRRLPLSGSWLQSATRATVSFDAYFLPDFPVGFKFAQQERGEEGSFTESYKRWDRTWPDFCEAYAAWFPDAPSDRRFLCKYIQAGGGDAPLPKLIVPLALPASLAEPLKVQHWIRCTEFDVPPRQRSVGQISNWQRPDDVLSLRRGSVQDHAVLLCCALLGLGKMAYVCKGTVQDGKEHAWVMTREQQGTVTFWETTTGGKFHLPNRWLGDPSHGDNCKKRVEARWKSSNANQEWRAQADSRRGLNRGELLSSMDGLVSLPISPWRELYKDENVVAIPYETVEVIFNGGQLWGNQGNHHPGCIYYDMEDDQRSWVPLVNEGELRHLHQGKGVAIPVGPAVSKYTALTLQDHIESEIKESVTFIRLRQGKESYFENDEVLQETLEGYLKMLELECQLDSDWCFNREDKQLKPWCGVHSPFNSFTYVQRCRAEWSRHWRMKKAMDEARGFLPVKENHVLSGIPLHISSTDMKQIRRNLMSCGPIQEYFGLPGEDVLFFVCAKVFPMPSSVNSVWIFLGAEVPLTPEKVYELVKGEILKDETEPPPMEAVESEPKGKKKKKKDRKAREETE